MTGGQPQRNRIGAWLHAALCAAGLAAVVLALPAGPLGASALAQLPAAEDIDPNTPMLVEADELVYDEVNNTVAAVGNVRIYYDGNTVEAARVTYDRTNGRVRAEGDVRITEPNGNIIYADYADLTDTLAEGFVQSLRIETPDRTRFAAERATRRDGNVTVFERGVYTACESCRENPERPPLWQIKATRIIYDQGERMVYYEGARLEFFGIPIAYLPFFAHADPTVERQSGFLRPDYLYNSELGYRIRAPYYFALAPNYDLTLTPAYYSRRGYMMQALWRHRLSNGIYTVSGAGMYEDPDLGATSGRDWRGYVNTTGRFSLNRQWSFGWDGTWISDETFLREYRISAHTGAEVLSQAYLTGLGERRWFDARVQRFEITRTPNLFTVPNDPAFTDPGLVLTDETDNQAFVHPFIDYEGLIDRRVFGGTLAFDVNITSLSRQRDDVLGYGIDPTPSGAYKVQELTLPLYPGYAGHYTRASVDLNWTRELIGPMGQVIRPYLGVRADAGILDLDTGGGPVAGGSDAFARVMPTAALEWRWPFLITGGFGTQIIEPIAQIIVRPDEMRAGELPNEDAQSLVFETNNLFEFDKFSGYDRVEGGIRANVGLRYTAQFAGGGSISAIIGQSFHIAGDNPYQVRDATRTGFATGLETDRSDIVASISAIPMPGYYIATSARFDDEDFTVQRVEATASFAQGPVSGGVRYAYLAARPSHTVFDDRQQVSGSLSVRFADYWRVYGGTTYDIDNTSLISTSVGLAYDDECLSIALTYTNTRNRYSDLVDPGHTVALRIDLRTLGEGQTSTRLSDWTEN